MDAFLLTKGFVTATIRFWLYIYSYMYPHYKLELCKFWKYASSSIHYEQCAITNR